MKISSVAFADGEAIPPTYTSEGKDISPPLMWEDVPEGAQSLALIVDDPDAPDPNAPTTVWVHWVLYNIPPDAAGLREGVHPENLPVGTKEGINDWQQTGYRGPAPPIGRHRYYHRLFALDTLIETADKPTTAQLLQAMKGHILASAELMGTYQKSR